MVDLKGYKELSQQLIDAILAKKDDDIKSNSDALRYKTGYIMHHTGTASERYTLLDDILTRLRPIRISTYGVHGETIDYDQWLKIAKEIPEMIDNVSRTSW